MPSPSPFLGGFLDQIILSIPEARNPTFGFRATYLEARFQSYLSQSQSPELSIFKQASRIGIQNYLSESQQAKSRIYKRKLLSQTSISSSQHTKSKAIYLIASNQHPSPKLSISKPAALEFRAIYLKASSIRI